MIPTLYGQTITVSFRGATALHGARYTATAVNPKTGNYNWRSVPQQLDRGIVDLITDAALAWLDHCQPDPWTIVGVAQNGTDRDSWHVFTVPLYMGYGLRQIGQNAIDAGKVMAAAT
jgi:hypothetical protein